MVKLLVTISLLFCNITYASAEADRAAMMAGTLVVVGFIIAFFIRLIGTLFTKTKNVVSNTIETNIKPFIQEKQREVKEDKLLKVKALFDSSVITEDEYKERSLKIEIQSLNKIFDNKQITKEQYQGKVNLIKQKYRQ